jgi:methylglyoxal synthase
MGFFRREDALSFFIFNIIQMKIGLIAHDNRKEDLLQWIDHNRKILKDHMLVCTGTTGKLVTDKLYGTNTNDANIKILKSGPLGGDQQIGSRIASDRIDILIFFWDPMAAQPHDPDVKALLRLSVVYNIPTACNRSTADYLISSPLFDNLSYKRIIKDYSKYINREVK